MPRNSVPLFPSRLFHQQIDILLLTVYEVNIQYYGRNSSVLSLVSCLIQEKISYRPRQNNVGPEREPGALYNVISVGKLLSAPLSIKSIFCASA